MAPKPKDPKCKFCGETDSTKFRSYFEKRSQTVKHEKSRCAKCHDRESHKNYVIKHGASKTKMNPKSARNYHLKNKYGLDLEEYSLMLKSQNYKCVICKSVLEDSRNWPVDHDHQTGKVRSILCYRCNTLLGQANDSIEILRAAIVYLGGDV